MRTLIKIKGFDHVELAGITAENNAIGEGNEAQAVIEFSKQSATLVANSCFGGRGASLVWGPEHR